MSGIKNISIFGGYTNRKYLICRALVLACLLGVTSGLESNPDCNVGWDGPDCTIPYEKCVDDGERKCYNGSKCVRNNKKNPDTGHYDFHCDCTAAQGVSVFAGRECEHASTIICEERIEHSAQKITEFCTNQGKCIEFQMNGMAKVGCDCPEEFSGSHCQYLKGTEGDFPDNNPLYVDDANVYGAEKREESGKTSAVTVAVVLGTLFVISFLGILGFFIYRNHYNRNQLETPEFSHKPPIYEHEQFQIEGETEMI